MPAMLIGRSYHSCQSTLILFKTNLNPLLNRCKGSSILQKKIKNNTKSTFVDKDFLGKSEAKLTRNLENKEKNWCGFRVLPSIRHVHPVDQNRGRYSQHTVTNDLHALSYSELRSRWLHVKGSNQILQSEKDEIHERYLDETTSVLNQLVFGDSVSNTGSTGTEEGTTDSVTPGSKKEETPLDSNTLDTAEDNRGVLYSDRQKMEEEFQTDQDQITMSRPSPHHQYSSKTLPQVKHKRVLILSKSVIY